MANALTQNPVIVVAIMAASFKASIPAVNQYPYLLIEKLYWEQPSHVGDTFQIEANDGTIIAAGQCGVAGVDVTIDWSAHPKIWSDFRVTQLSSGTLFIYLR